MMKADEDGVREPVKKAILAARAELLCHIDRFPEFRWSLEPIGSPSIELPEFISDMYRAGFRAGVGPFASVAGALAQVAVQAAVDSGAANVLVENGGDLCLYGEGPFIVGVHAGSSPLSQKMGFEIFPGQSYAGLCTSSASVGESISFGEAEAVVAYCPSSAPIADAAATAICNEVKGQEGVARGIERAKMIRDVGVLIIQGERLAAWGNLPEMIGLETGKVDLVMNPDLHSRAF